MSRRTSPQPIVADRSLLDSTSSENGQGEFQIVCGPITDRQLAEEASRADIAFYMSHGGQFSHPAQHALRESLTAINRSAESATDDCPNAQQVAGVAVRRRTIAAATGLEVFAGTGTIRFGGMAIRALLVYCAPPDTVSVTVDIPVALFWPPALSAIH
jgi:hypothetical protein